MNKRKILIGLVAFVLLASAVVFAQTRLRSRGAQVGITSTGGVAVTPFSGQSIALQGNTAVTGTLATSGLYTAAAGITLGAGSNLTTDTGTAAATGGAATLSKQSGVITSEALTTAAAAAYTLTLTNTVVAATSRVLVSVDNGTNTQGIPVVGTVTPGSGSVVIKIYNLHASQALNGTLKIAFFVVK